LFYHETPFKAAITDLVKSGQIGMVLMLMGATWQEAPGLQVSYYGKQTDYDFESRLRLKLSPLEQIGGEREDKYIKPLATFIADDLGVPTLAVRMSRRYRMPRLQGMLFNRATELLAEFVNECGAELTTRQRF
jgi:hypothetical protein